MLGKVDPQLQMLVGLWLSARAREGCHRRHAVGLGQVACATAWSRAAPAVSWLATVRRLLASTYGVQTERGVGLGGGGWLSWDGRLGTAAVLAGGVFLISVGKMEV